MRPHACGMYAIVVPDVRHAVKWDLDGVPIAGTERSRIYFNPRITNM